MIKFKSIFFKNFQSVGDAGMTVCLDAYTTTVVGGENGSGKSNVAEALMYNLFGKTLKRVKLPNLVNSRNNKALVTESVFEVNGNEYKVIRGQKPKKFEIYKNDEMIDQDAASKDYQKKLESILGMDFALAQHLMVLNRERYVPFMDLAAGDRRKVVEDVLGINIFSYMNDEVKEAVSELNRQISNVEDRRNKTRYSLDSYQRLLDESQTFVDDQITDIQSKIDEDEQSVQELDKKREQINTKIEGYGDVQSELNKKRRKYDQYKQIGKDLKDKIGSYQKSIDFFEETDDCPTCYQPIDESIKQQNKDHYQGKIDEIKTKSGQMVDVVNELVESIRAKEAVVEEKNTLVNQLRDVDNEIRNTRNRIDQRKQEITNLESKKDGKASEYQQEITNLNEQMTDLDAEYDQLVKDKEDYDNIKAMLKDDGIKATIIDDYVDFINVKVNEYLNEMGFYINITLDSNFNEQINSVNKSNFTYDNLSTGQKTRVNLAVWMVLLEVASLKNSVVTNFLMLDEVLEAIDQDGVNMFMDLVKEKMTGKNLFVITQRFDEFKDYFDNEYFLYLNDGFSEIS